MEKFRNISYIFWDWNGTILNDLQACLGAMNKILSIRGMETITEDKYKKIFGFPVKNYYKSLGFDFSNESFEELSVEFMREYHNLSHTMSVANFAFNALKSFSTTGAKQVILSAMEQGNLTKQVMDFGLYHFFNEILGIDNIYAASKTNIAKEYIKKNNIDITDAILIGDTLHDFEVARELNILPVLIANGHQTKERLSQTGATIFNNLNELLSYS